MIAVKVGFDHGEFTYLIDRFEGAGMVADPADPWGDVVADHFESIMKTRDQLVGPQTGPLTGARSNYLHALHLVAALWDAASYYGGTIISWQLSADEHDPDVPIGERVIDVPPAEMTRAERLAEAQQAWQNWARTATTDEPPDDLLRPFALTEADFRAMSDRPVHGED